MSRAKRSTYAHLKLPGARSPKLRAPLAAGKTLLGYRAPDPGNQAPAEPTKKTRLAEPVWAANRFAHGICIGPTGTGKGRSSLIPDLLTYPGSAVVVDPCGEAAKVTSRYRAEQLDQDVYIVDPFGVIGGTSSTFNPLDIRAFTGERLEDFALGVPHLIHPDYKHSSKEPFWDNQADLLLSAITCSILATEAQSTRHLPRVAELLFGDDTIFELAKFLDTSGAKVPRFAYRNISNFLNTTEQTRSGILSVAQQHVQLFSTRTVQESIKTTSLDIQGFSDGVPMTIYLVLPPNRLKSHGVLLRMWLSGLLRIALNRKRMPTLPTSFYVDELAQIGTLNEIETAYTLMRKYGIRMAIYLQDLQQLQRLYPDSWRTLLGNAGVMQAFRPNTRIAARQLAKLFPKALKADDLLGLDEDQQVILEQGGRYARSRKLDYLHDPLYAGRFDINPLYGERTSLN